MITPFLERTLGANWRTSLSGGIDVVATFIVANPELVAAVLAPSIAKKVFSAAALVSGFIAFRNAKDKQITGGLIVQPTPGYPRAAGEPEDKIPGL